MRIFVTAGNTQSPIDRVRCITNIFTGRTGAGIALEAYRRGHHVLLATSHPEAVGAADLDPVRWRCERYRTFDDLDALMAEHIGAGQPDAVVHCAAVSDYRCAGVYAPAATTHFDADQRGWHDADAAPTLVNRAAGKVKSDEQELWLRLVRTPKLVDRIRSDWRFRGVLVKFKLEVDVSDEALERLAEASRRHSDADWMVANTLDGAAEWALVGNADGYRRLQRTNLARILLDLLETRLERNDRPS